MKYIKKEYPCYNLHMIKTDKFKTTNIEVIFEREIKKEDITITNFLSSILTFTTKKYNTKLKYAKKMESLYAARLFANSYRLGSNFNVDFNMQILNDKYAENGLLNESLEFLKEVLFNPNVTDGKFDEVSFNIIKNDESSQIERFKEDTRRYATLRCCELTDDKAPFSYNLKGYMEDLNKITSENLYSYYNKFIESSNVDIFIIGNIEIEEVEKMIEEKFQFTNKNQESKYPLLPTLNNRKKRKEIIETDNTNQSKLAITCRIESMTDKERNYVLNLYNSILGGSTDSKFFKNIREKYSLCYYATTGANKLDNILLISSGITKENYNKMLILIDKEMDDIKKGYITEDELINAKKYYLSGLEEIEDSPNQIIASYYAIDKLKADSIEERKEKIKDITKEEIVALANKIYIDTVYLLGGDKKC